MSRKLLLGSVIMTAMLAVGILSVGAVAPKAATPLERAQKAYNEAVQFVGDKEWDQAKQKFEEVVKIVQRDMEQPMRNRFAKENRIAQHTLKNLALLKSVEGQTYKDGVYKGQAKGYVGPVEVGVKVKDGKISDCAVTQNQESRAKTSLQDVPQRIVKKNSVMVDAVSGATITSNAVREAAARALEKAVEKTEEKPAQTEPATDKKPE